MSIRSGLLVFSIVTLMNGSCINLNKKIVFQPEAALEKTESTESGSIAESQSSPIPEWLSIFISGGIPEAEALPAWQNCYVFIGQNRGTNFNALKQWADGFSAVQDFPRLAAARIEKRLTAAASLYPDDEYGAYFEAVVKKASDAEYPGVLKEETFWIKRQTEYSAGTMETEAGETQDTYEFFVLFVIDKTVLQSCIREILSSVKTAVQPTRAQNAAINRARQNFFEGF
jgi:hypothetical protein